MNHSQVARGPAWVMTRSQPVEPASAPGASQARRM